MAILALAIFGLAMATPSLAAGSTTDWEFEVLLDTRPIGTHRFEVVDAGDGLKSVSSEADFAVKLLGLTVYRYHHLAKEQWRADCLSAVNARTDDDGEVTVVTGEYDAGRFKVVASSGKKPRQVEAEGCLLSFAYWNPAQLARQRQLLDQGTGRIETVNVTPLAATTIQVRGEPTTVTGLRISGLKAPIDVWYARDHWVGLDTTAGGGRRLTYRLP